MVDEASRYAVRFLDALAATNARLIELSQQLRARREVAEVSHRLECKGYDSGAFLEGYVDAELRQGHALTWWLELRWEGDRWSVETSVLITHNEGQDTLVGFPPRCALTLDECLIQLDAAAAELVDSLKTVDLGAAVAAS